MKSFTAFLIFVSAILLLIGCGNPEIVELDGNYFDLHPEPVFNRSLTDAEIAPSTVLYHMDCKNERSIHANFPAPKTKPKIQWSRKVKHVYPNQIIVDSRGGTWFYCHPGSQKGDIYYHGNDDLGMNDKPWIYLIRLNPDGSLSCNNKYNYIDPEFLLIMVCEDAVISLIKTYNLAPSTEDAVTTSEYIEAYFNELRGYIPPHDLSLECVDLQGNTIWRTASSKVDYDNYNIPSIWRISKNRIMIPTGEKKSRKFNIYSLSDGSLLGTFQFPEWAIENGHLTMKSVKLPDGTEIWPAPNETQIYLETFYWTPKRWAARKVIYSDGSVLTHDGKSLNLSDKTGRKIWALSLKDLGFDDKTASIKGKPHPAPDGRIVIFIDSEDPKRFGGGWDSFISLKSEKS